MDHPQSKLAFNYLISKFSSDSDPERIKEHRGEVLEEVNFSFFKKRSKTLTVSCKSAITAKERTKSVLTEN